MMFWIREIVGWLLLALALYLLRISLNFVMDLPEPKLVEGAIVAMAALGVLRASLYLIRLATAARICRLK